jgi:hypothetical protein
LIYFLLISFALDLGQALDLRVPNGLVIHFQELNICFFGYLIAVDTYDDVFASIDSSLLFCCRLLDSEFGQPGFNRLSHPTQLLYFFD